MNPLLAVWQQLFGAADTSLAVRRRISRIASIGNEAGSSSAIFLVLRRMRAPLIALILIYAVSVLGLTLIPGQDANGMPWRMSFFHAFYFMSYTATTIGFGEIPHAFTDAQRLWVTFCIYLTVIGWAYAVGMLLALLQDRAFRTELAAQRFARQVRRLNEPFYVIAGFGQTGRMLGRALDTLGQRFVVVDIAESRVDGVQLQDYRAHVPAWVADAGNPEHMRRAGLENPRCRGLFALTDDDETNLAAAMCARFLRPDMPVLASTLSRSVGERMRAIGTTYIVNAFDRFGDLLTLAVRAPATLRVMEWLTGVPGSELPVSREPPRGLWISCGYGRFGREIAADLIREGLEVTVIEPQRQADCPVTMIVGHGVEPDVLREAGIDRAAGLIAGTDNDTTNLSIIAAARALNPGLFVVARQNRRSNAALFAATGVDYLLQPAEVIAHECLARLTTPYLMRFLDVAHAHDNAWSARLVERVSGACGRHVPLLWSVRLDAHGAPAIARWLGDRTRTLTVGDLLRDPADRENVLPVVPLLVLRGADVIELPPADCVLRAGDLILLAGRHVGRRRLADTLERDATRDYVLTGRHVPVGWLWQRVSGQRPA